MPITKSAIKALRQDQTRTKRNQVVRTQVKTALDKVKADPNPENISKAYQALDRAAKKNVIHANKAARLKSQVSKNRQAPKASKPTSKTKKTKSSK